jgi:hypothetical protein
MNLELLSVLLTGDQTENTIVLIGRLIGVLVMAYLIYKRPQAYIFWSREEDNG